jgi:hypothetical protein
MASLGGNQSYPIDDHIGFAQWVTSAPIPDTSTWKSIYGLGVETYDLGSPEFDAPALS